MSYFTREHLTGLVPDQWLVDATDDTDSGEPTLLDVIIDNAENAINAVLGGRYALPLDLTDLPLAAAVREIGICIAVESLFIRRNTPIDPKGMLAIRVGRAMDRLKALGDGTDALSVNITPAHPPGVIISDPSRTASSSLAA